MRQIKEFAAFCRLANAFAIEVILRMHWWYWNLRRLHASLKVFV
jgi:hypothetical protein